MRKTDRHRKSCIATAETLEGRECFIFKEIFISLKLNFFKVYIETFKK